MSADDVVIVTGAGGNLGAAVVALLAERGYLLVAMDRTEAALRRALEPPAAIRGRILAEPGIDLGDPAACGALAGRAVARFGRIRRAGPYRRHVRHGRPRSAEAAHWELLFKVNLFTALNMCRAVAPAMRQRGQGQHRQIGSARPARRARAWRPTRRPRAPSAPDRELGRRAQGALGCARTASCPAPSTRRRTAPPCPTPIGELGDAGPGRRRHRLPAVATPAAASPVLRCPSPGGAEPGARLLGLIGGMSWESTAIYYRHLNELARERLGGLHSARLLLWSVDFAEVAGLQHAATGPPPALAGRRGPPAGGGGGGGTGAVHQHHAQARRRGRRPSACRCCTSPMPPAPRRAAGCRRPALLATRFTMEQDFYPDRLRDRHGLEAIVPDEAGRTMVHDSSTGSSAEGSSGRSRRRATLPRSSGCGWPAPTA